MKNSLLKWLSCLCKGTTYGYATRKDCIVVFGFEFLIVLVYYLIFAILGIQVHDIVYYIPSILTIIATFSLIFMRINDIFGKRYMKGRIFAFFGIYVLIELFGRIIAKIIFDIQPIDSAGWLGLPFLILLCIWPPSYKNREEMPDVEYRLTRKTIAILIFTVIITSGLFSYWTAEPDALTYNDLGLTYVEKGDYEQAIMNYSRAIQLSPDFAEVYYYNRGNAYKNKGDYDSAIIDFNQVIQLEPNSAMAYNSRGLVYFIKGDYDKAIMDYNQAILIDTNLAMAYNNRGLAYFNKSDYDKAIMDYNQAILIDANLIMAYYNRGYVHIENDDYDSAILDFNRVIRLDPNYANAYNNRGFVYFIKGDYDKAIADYNQALQINPNDINVMQNLELARKSQEQEARSGERKMLAEEY